MRRWSAEVRRKMSETHKRLYRTNPRIRKHVQSMSSHKFHTTDSYRKIGAARTKYLASHKAYSSKLEERASEVLTGFKRRFWMGGKLGGHAFDYGNKKLHIVVDIHGCWWHSHGCYMGSSGYETNDKRATKLAKRFGYKLLILWQCQEKSWRKRVEEVTGVVEYV